MPLKAAFWVHGNQAIAENAGPWLNARNVTWGSIYKTAGGSHWFHVPITTPVFLENQRVKLTKVFVFYETKHNAKLMQVEVFDGRKQVRKFPNLSLEGYHTDAIDDHNGWVINPPAEIYYGLGLSVLVSFDKISDEIPEILFTSFGADFIPGANI